MSITLFPDLHKPSTVSTTAPSPVAAPEDKAKAILARLSKETNFEPRVDQWGATGKGLFLVKTGWDSLTDADKNKIIEYAKSNGISAILVGKLVEKQPKNTVTLDETVWSSDAKAAAPNTNTSSSNNEKQTESKCRIAAGHMWTGVRVYLDSNCEKPFATILGGTKVDGEKGVVLKFDGGETEVKLRSAVRDDAYVMEDDPAIERQQWQEF